MPIKWEYRIAVLESRGSVQSARDKRFKKLARVMRDLHISAGERRIWPLVADENHIYWIAFLRGSNYGLPDKNTKKYLLITLKKENREDEES